MTEETPNVVPLNGRWMFLFKIHLAAIGPVFVGLISLAAWNFRAIAELTARSNKSESDISAMRIAFDIIVRDGSPITRERLAVIESTLKIGKAAPP